MASLRLKDYLLSSCKFSPLVNGLLACTAIAENTCVESGILKIVQNNYSNLDTIKSLIWPSDLLEASWSPLHGNLVTTASADGCLELWNVLEPFQKSPIATYMEHQGAVTTVVWKPVTGIHMVSGSLDANFKIWDVNYSVSVSTTRFEDSILQISPNIHIPDLVSVVLANRKIILFDDRSPEASLSKSIEEQAVSSDWTPANPNTLLAASANGALVTLDLRNMKRKSVVTCHSGPIKRVRGLPHRMMAVTCGFDGSTVVSNIWNGEVAEQILHHSSSVHDVDYNPFQPQQIVDCSWDSLLHVFEPKTLRQTFCIVNKL